MQTTEVVSLKPGHNRIDDVQLILDQAGYLQRVRKFNYRASNRFSGFLNFRLFLEGGVSFLSLLVFCCFFLWYDRQKRSPRMLSLKRYTLMLFSFVAI